MLCPCIIACIEVQEVRCGLRALCTAKVKKTYSTWHPQAVSHPSTNQARPCLASEIGRVQRGMAVSQGKQRKHTIYKRSSAPSSLFICICEWGNISTLEQLLGDASVFRKRVHSCVSIAPVSMAFLECGYISAFVSSYGRHYCKCLESNREKTLDSSIPGSDREQNY